MKVALQGSNSAYLDRITNSDCILHLPKLKDDSIHLFLSDIPYGICLDDWDVLHDNRNSALLGQSPAQIGKVGFKRRGKPINGWSQTDRSIGEDYYKWCLQWCQPLFPKMKVGSSLFVFGARRTLHRAINAFEESGFLLKDILAWEKSLAHHRAQRISCVFKRRNNRELQKRWEGWRIGNLAPIFEPIAWFVKPYRVGGTVVDTIIKNSVGAMNVDGCFIDGKRATNLLTFGFQKGEARIHEAQKPLALVEFLISLTTVEGQIILDPFMGSGTTAIASAHLSRHFIGFEVNKKFYQNSIHRLQNENNYKKEKEES